MPRYRFILPVRAVGSYRLPEGDITADNITILPASPPAYTARVDGVKAENAPLAFERAQQLSEQLFSYLALLGEGAAFILDGREGVRGRNLDLAENPVPAEQPPPPFESIGGVIAAAGQEFFGALLDPDGNMRRTGGIVVHNARGSLTPGQDRVNELCQLFTHRITVPPRLRIALGIIHDAACSREFTSGFSQSFTALEVLTEHLRPPTVLDGFFQEAREHNTVDTLPYGTKTALLTALREFLIGALLSPQQANRITNYVSMTQSVSQVDVFCGYLTSLGIGITRAEVAIWRGIRGALVHAATANAEQTAAMRRCRDVVRTAVLEDLRRTARAQG